MSNTPITVGLADDQILVRAGFAMVLDSQEDIEVCWQAANGREAVEAARSTPCDVILMDIQMPELNGIDATKALVDEGISARIVVLTTFDNDEYVIGSIAAGASGFLLKDTDPEELIDAVRTVGESAAVVSPKATARLLRQIREGMPGDGQRGAVDGEPRNSASHAPGSTSEVVSDGPRLPDLPEPLTVRELEILRLIAMGRSNTEIADELFLSLSTVKTHVGRVLAKTGSRDRVHVVLWAFRHGVVDSDDMLSQ